MSLALDAVVDLTQFKTGSILVYNREERMKKILSDIDELKASERVSKQQLESLVGKLQFSSQFVFGGGLKHVLVKLDRAGDVLNEAFRCILDFVRQWITRAKP
eukprot:5611995-Amphidinium_carterae.1